MNGDEIQEESNIGLIIGIFIVVLILFFIIGVIGYFSLGNSNFFRSGNQPRNGDEEYDAFRQALMEAHNQRINEFNQQASDNGFPEFVIDLDAQLNPNSISRVEIINASGETETVQVCDNNAGFQPLYVSKQLVCSNGMLPVIRNSDTEPPFICCRYNTDFDNMPNPVVVDTLASHAFNALNTAEGALGFCNSAPGSEQECAIPLEYKAMAAGVMGAFMKKGWFKNAYKSSKRLLGTKNALVSVSDFFSESIKAKKDVKMVGKITSGLLRSNHSKTRFAVFKDALKAEQEAFVKEVNSAKTAAEDAEKAFNTAKDAGMVGDELKVFETAANKAKKKLMIKTAARAGKAVGKEAFKGLTKILEVDAVVGAACSAAIGWTGVGELGCGALIIALDVLMVIDMALALMEECDVGGFQQYQGNDTVILPMRDAMEGQVINLFSSMGSNPPFIFALSSIDTFPTLNTKSDLSDFKDIKHVYELALTDYEHSIPQFKEGQPSEHNQRSITVAISRGERVGEDVHRTMYRTINDNPQERDEHIWNYLKNNLNDTNKSPGSNPNELKYLMYVPELSSNTLIAITLNDAGIEKYNTEASRLNSKYLPPKDGVENPSYANDPEKIESPLPLLIKSKYYRTINSVQNQGLSNQIFVLQQNELPKEMTIESYSMALIKAQCTTGMNKDELPNKKAMEEHPNLCALGETEIHHPNEHGCGQPGQPICYNKDTGLCNTTLQWCREMGMGVLVNKSFTGNGVTQYSVCDTSGAQEFISFTISEEGAKRFQRITQTR